MPRQILGGGAVLWLVVGTIAAVVAAIGREWLHSLLPPLAIDAEALGGALLAVALAMLSVGGAHIVVLVGLKRGLRLARSAGALLASVLAAVLVGLVAAAVSSALRYGEYASPLAAAAVLAAVGVVGYVVVAIRLVAQMRSEAAS